ncbi:FAD-dependent oxidoreductase [Mycobacterium sp. NPDC050441]|uniref:FAD-dependent oxidoreductase n=1 Tax=Mycobacterium sp. NPDC050441 TaxID=3155403 RepID=UPI0033F24439
MAYVITQNCCNDASCVAACPVGCIHPSPDEPGFAAAEMLYIDPDTCIDCGACADACPVDAIRPRTRLSVAHERYREINADYYRRHPAPPTFKRATTPRPLVTQPLRVAIVGSGPAGLYSAEALLHHPGVRVDMFDRLPFPHGLVRYGVAPDHPATKAVVDQFDFSPEKRRRFDLHLGIEIGTDLSHAELQQRYSAVIYATGAFHPRLLDIPGAQLPGSAPAAAFVGWYNDHPDHRDLSPDLSGDRAVIVGNGNVALDMARILSVDPETLRNTGIARRALSALHDSMIREVVIIGRRGPQDAAFTVPELLALTHIPDIDVVVDPADLSHGPASSSKAGLLNEIAHTPAREARTRIVFQFNSTPTAIRGGQRVSGLQLHMAAGSHREIEAGLVLHSIGFQGRAIPGVPFDDHRHTIPHHQGRVLDTATGQPMPGVYTVGWIKRGPTGVIGTNRTCAEETVSALLDDVGAGRLTAPSLQPAI